VHDECHADLVSLLISSDFDALIRDFNMPKSNVLNLWLPGHRRNMFAKLVQAQHFTVTRRRRYFHSDGQLVQCYVFVYISFKRRDNF